MTIVTRDSQDLLVLVSVPHEVEAAVIVAALEEEGIRAVAAGGNTSAFKAEAPGEVQVLVSRSNAARAQQTIRKIQSQENPIDWSAVDVGEPEQ